MIKRIPMIDGLRVDEAHKGGAKGPSKAQIEAEKAQTKELEDLRIKEESRTKAMSRRRRGRASLLSGSELGENKQTLGA